MLYKLALCAPTCKQSISVMAAFENGEPGNDEETGALDLAWQLNAGTEFGYYNFSKEVIEVGDVNFLTGKNGAGKSTVIDALQIVLLGETNARNFNLAANERSQRTLDGYLRADMDENNPYSRRGKDFSTYIVCEFEDDVEHNSFVCGVMFDCRSDGSKHDHFFIYVGKLPEN